MAGAVWEEARDGQPTGRAADPEFTAAEITALAEVFPPVRPARSLLRASDFPMTEMPAAPDTAIDFWTQVSESLANGVRPGGRQLILAAAARRYPGQDMFRVMAGSSASGDSSAAVPGGPGSPGRARAADRVTRVLVIGASPEGAERIRPDRDARAIEQARAGGFARISANVWEDNVAGRGLFENQGFDLQARIQVAEHIGLSHVGGSLLMMRPKLTFV